jgi:hypothetical protein
MKSTEQKVAFLFKLTMTAVEYKNPLQRVVGRAKILQKKPILAWIGEKDHLTLPMLFGMTDRFAVQANMLGTCWRFVNVSLKLLTRGFPLKLRADFLHQYQLEILRRGVELWCEKLIKANNFR